MSVFCENTWELKCKTFFLPRALPDMRWFLEMMVLPAYVAHWPLNGLQGDGETSLVFPLIPVMKSDHLYTFPSPARQDFDISLITDGDNTWSQTLTFPINPLNMLLGWKRPPSLSWSCASIKYPPDLITWPVLNSPSCSISSPSW